MFDLSGKVALVTGATSGIGQQQARALAEAGAKVVALGRRIERLDETVSAIEALGGEGAALPADLSVGDGLTEVADKAGLFFGPIDILCNTAGVNLRQHADDVTPESWRRTIDLNLAVPIFFGAATGARYEKKALGTYY